MPAAPAPASLSVPALLAHGFAAYRAHFGLFLAAAALAQLPAALVSLLAGYGASATLDQALGGTIPDIGVGETERAVAVLLSIGGGRAIAFGLLLVAGGVANVIGTVLSTGALTYLLAERVEGRGALGIAYRAVLARLWPLFGAILLAGFIICAVLGVVLAIYVVLFAVQYMLVPAGEAPPDWVQLLLWLVIYLLIFGALGYALFAFVRWALFIPAVVLEDAGPRDALRRSAVLLRRRWWHTALLLTALAVGQSVLSWAASALLGSLLGGLGNPSLVALASGLGFTLASVLYFPLAANALTLLYLGLRAREAAPAAVAA
jgi:hypothetical protein